MTHTARAQRVELPECLLLPRRSARAQERDRLLVSIEA